MGRCASGNSVHCGMVTHCPLVFCGVMHVECCVDVQNVIERRPPATYFELLWEALEDTTMRLLFVAGCVSLILGLTLEEDKETSWIEVWRVRCPVAA